VNAKPGVIEGVLNTLQIKMAKYREKKAGDDNQSQYRENVPQTNNRPAPVEAPARKEVAKAAAAPISHAPQASHAPQRNNHNQKNVVASVDEELLLEKEQTIRDLQETVEILELKIAKLEQLVRLKDSKIQKLQQGR
jgi:hypothetical protein